MTGRYPGATNLSFYIRKTLFVKLYTSYSFIIKKTKQKTNARMTLITNKKIEEIKANLEDMLYTVYHIPDSFCLLIYFWIYRRGKTAKFQVVDQRKCGTRLSRDRSSYVFLLTHQQLTHTVCKKEVKINNVFYMATIRLLFYFPLIFVWLAVKMATIKGRVAFCSTGKVLYFSYLFICM